LDLKPYFLDIFKAYLGYYIKFLDLKQGKLDDYLCFRYFKAVLFFGSIISAASKQREATL